MEEAKESLADLGGRLFCGMGSWVESELLSVWVVSMVMGSEAKSSAPNCTLSPLTSAEPGISTAEEGIFEGGAGRRLGGLCLRGAGASGPDVAPRDEPSGSAA